MLGKNDYVINLDELKASMLDEFMESAMKEDCNEDYLVADIITAKTMIDKIVSIAKNKGE